MTPLLSSFYFGSIEHYRLLAQYEKVIIDIGEHYERQSYRTRTSIIGPNGRQDLVVPIARKSGERMPMKSVGLTYIETWPQQHMHAIRSAYGNTPWFIHYIDGIEAVVLNKYERLVDLDLATMRLGMKWLGLKTVIEVSETYVEVESGEWRVASAALSRRAMPKAWAAGRVATEESRRDSTRHSSLITRHSLDLRSSFHPKKPLPPEVSAVPSYTQVFADRHGSVPRMSIIDLVMNMGPEAQCIVKLP